MSADQIAHHVGILRASTGHDRRFEVRGGQTTGGINPSQTSCEIGSALATVSATGAAA